MATAIIECATCSHYEDPPYLGPGITGPGICNHPDSIKHTVPSEMEDDHPPYCPLVERAIFSGALGAVAEEYVQKVRGDIRFKEPEDIHEPKIVNVVGRDVSIECAFIFDEEVTAYLKDHLSDEEYRDLMSYTDMLMFPTGEGFCGWVDTSMYFRDMTPNPIVDMKFTGGTSRDILTYLPRSNEKSWFEAAYGKPEDMIEENKDFFANWLEMPEDFDWPRHIVDINGTVKR